MKFNTRIRTDKHGLYIKTGGNIFRPQVDKYSTPYLYATADAESFTAGEHVHARHIPQSTLAKITKVDQTHTIWYSHGSYLGVGLDLKSEECWRPAEKIIFDSVTSIAASMIEEELGINEISDVRDLPD